MSQTQAYDKEAEDCALRKVTLNVLELSEATTYRHLPTVIPRRVKCDPISVPLGREGWLLHFPLVV